MFYFGYIGSKAIEAKTIVSLVPYRILEAFNRAKGRSIVADVPTSLKRVCRWRLERMRVNGDSCANLQV